MLQSHKEFTCEAYQKWKAENNEGEAKYVPVKVNNRKDLSFTMIRVTSFRYSTQLKELHALSFLLCRFQEMVKKENWRQCPSCKFVAELIQGCKFMTCVVSPPSP